MIHAKQNLISLLVVSLLVAVISLPGSISLAAVAPKAQAMPPVRDGMLTPTRMVMGSSGYYYVTDFRVKAVLKYNAYGQLVQTINTAENPLGIALDRDGNLVVTQGKYVVVINPATGDEIRRMGLGYIAKASGVAVDGNNRICVTDSATHQVYVFNPAGGAPYKTFGGYGNAIGTTTPAYGLFHGPAAIVYEKDAQQLAIADAMNGRIQFFNTTTYDYVKQIGGTYSYDLPLDFISPQGISFEYDRVTGKLKRMYVVDTWKSTIQVIDPLTPSGGNEGTFLSLIGAGEIAAGNWVPGILGGIEDWQLLVPSDVVFDPTYSRLFVPGGTSSIQVFGIDGGKSPTQNSPHYLTINASPLNTNQTTYLISGTVKANSIVKINITNTTAVAGPVTYPTATTWSATITGLTVGSNNISVTATDVVQKVLVKEVTVVYSQTAPSLAITTASGTVTNQLANYPITGTVGDANCTVSIKNNTTGVTTAATVAANKQWTGSATLSANVANNFTVTASRPGYSDASATVSIISDTIPPSLTVSALPDGSYSSNTLDQNVSGFVTDANPATVSIAVNGNAPTIIQTPVKGALFSQLINLSSGAGGNTIAIQATDKAGNISAVDTRKIYYDATKPVLAIVTAPTDNSFTKTAAAPITVTTTATFTVTNNGVAVPVTPTTGKSVTVTLVNGLNTIVMTATSGANVASLKRTVTLDNLAPSLSITPATGFSTKVPNHQIKGAVSADEVGGYPIVTVTVNGTPLTSPIVSNGSFTFDSETLLEGLYQVVVTATDKAGNASSVPLDINYDITPPVITLTKILLGRISGTMEAGSSVTVYDGATTFPVVASGTTWEANLIDADFNKNTITMKATDAAGMTSIIPGLTSVLPTGDFDGIGGITPDDARGALRCAVGLDPITAAQLLRADVGPLLRGKANPSGEIDLVDALLILKKYTTPGLF